MSMCNVICVTNRRLAGDDFLGQIRKVAGAGVSGIILREKDLDEPAYEKLAEQVQRICGEAGAPFFVHTYGNAARRLGVRRLHMPGPAFFAMTEPEKKDFDVIGVSVHSPEEAAAAERAGASYVTAGHVFATDCKKGLEPRGLSFLEEVCRTVQIPVYAIGGIDPGNAGDCIRAGAAGVCLMSSLMKAKDPVVFLS